MHLAHQKLFENLDKNGAIVVIETGYASLSPKTHREDYTSFPIFYYPLENIKHLEAKQFIFLLKEEYPKLKTIVVGYDFHFGAKAKYSISHLREFFDGQVIVVNKVICENIAVHSKTIRSLLCNGEIELANKFLNKNYKITGRAIKGQGLGKEQFVPTINLNCGNFLLPQNGVYATKTIINDKEKDSITFIGHRLTTDGKFAVETHILDEDISEIHSTIQIKFFKKIRENKKFENYTDLKQQILKDIDNVKIFYTRAV